MKHRFFVKNNKALYLQVRHAEQKTAKKITDLLIEYWNPSTGLPMPGCEDYENLLAFVLHVRARAAKIQFQQMTETRGAMDFLFQGFDVEQTQKGGADDFFLFFERVVQELQNNGKEGNAIVYNTALNKLKQFVDVLYFENINTKTMERFKYYLQTQGLKNTSIHNYLRTIRAVYNKAVKIEGVQDNKPFAGVFNDVTVRARRLKNRYMDKKLLGQFRDLELTHPSHQRVVDLSMLQFYLGGMDLIDIYYMERANLVGGRYYYTRKKLGARGYEIDIMVPPQALEIIKRYQGNDKKYLFDWLKLPAAYRNFRSNQIRRLKSIQQKHDLILLPTNAALNTKTFRHTFATIAKFEHVDPDLIRELMGHERNDIDTVYKDKFLTQERDAAQMKIISLE